MLLTTSDATHQLYSEEPPLPRHPLPAMSDFIAEALAWPGGPLPPPLPPPITLVPVQESTHSSWRLPRGARVVPRPSFRNVHGATFSCRTISGVPRRRRPGVAAAWGTVDPLAPIGTVKSSELGQEPPLVTLHVNNQSCAASGSEAFFNLMQHGGRRGTAISRSSSCVSAFSRGSYNLHGYGPPTPPVVSPTHLSLVRRPSNVVPGRRVGRSFSTAPGDGSCYGAGGPRVAGRRPPRQPIFPAVPEQHLYHQNLVRHQPAALHKTFTPMERSDALDNDKQCVAPRGNSPRPCRRASRPRRWSRWDGRPATQTPPRVRVSRVGWACLLAAPTRRCSEQPPTVCFVAPKGSLTS
ncbi:uncharacterized protein LOC135101237 isoform X1 [Scylla paramamosain]|uniref:uncharacterized protein LOC135101237 isoform X1 n=1 Tax=Scylla paramamosain TaxID=85552 RepID=UPI00308306BE